MVDLTAGVSAEHFVGVGSGEEVPPRKEVKENGSRAEDICFIIIRPPF